MLKYMKEYVFSVFKDELDKQLLRSLKRYIEMKKTIEYVTPEVVCMEMKVEGVLCASVDTEVGDGGDAFDIE